MQFTVRDWMINLLVFIDPDKSVTEALTLMRRRYMDSLLVNKTKNNPEYGIVTAIDICDKIVAQGRDPSETKVREIMVYPLITINQTMNIRDCASLMKEKRIHHLPVVDDHGTLVGMIAATDFLVVAESIGHGGGERTLT
ncbi:MAG TPA: CBS domain-containing protein [Longilinea sp.]|jgi:signal-transduction protein with cAMP-binding, CBS, and nucleotidyltransferase domain|nr:CBS domain-containing protein [Longilinea sp.]